MALNQIWKQQLTLVTYGNEYLRQNLSFNQWRQHHIFDHHSFQFRDLTLNICWPNTFKSG